MAQDTAQTAQERSKNEFWKDLGWILGRLWVDFETILGGFWQNFEWIFEGFGYNGHRHGTGNRLSHSYLVRKR